MSVREELVRILADGRLHSGSAVAAALGVSRSAVWKQVHRLADLGLEIRAEGRRGYCLTRAIEFLDGDKILGSLDAETRAACEGLEVLLVTGSTSTALAARPIPSPGAWRGVLAEYQTGGRGRRGRRWASPFGSGLCLSVSWCFATAPRELPALSLAAGIAVGRALGACGATGMALKWPNDVVVAGAKLAGILVDVEGDSRGPLRAIVGVGLNISVPDSLVAAVAAQGGLAPAGLERAVPGGTVQRNAVAAQLLRSLYQVLRDFAQQGFGPLADEWRRHDFLCGRPVTVRQGTEEVVGIAMGIAADGALLVERPEGIAAVFNGDVTLRTAA